MKPRDTSLKLKALLTLLTAGKIAVLILLATFTLPHAVSAESGSYDWTNEDEGVIEPPRAMMLGWNANEVPHNISVYYDVDGDGNADIAFAHTIIKMNTGVYCDADKLASDFYLVFSTCPNPHAADYYVTRQWILYRISRNGNGWKRLFMLIDELDTRRKTIISQCGQTARHQDPRGEGSRGCRN